MSAPYIIPFNFQPVNTGAGSSTYTVPSGKYARLTFTCRAHAVFTLSGGSDLNSFSNNSANQVTTGEVWLKSGDVITTSLTNANGTFTGGASTWGSSSSASHASILLNGTTFSRAHALITGCLYSNNATGTFAGDSAVNFMYEEYNVIS